MGLGAEPGPVLAAVRQVYRMIDAAVESGALGLSLPCRAGCDDCCHEAVFVSAPEFLLVADDLLRSRTVDERRRISDEMRQIAGQFEDELALLDWIEPGPERDEVAARIRFRCPLLAQGGKCSVYPVRELNARTFGQARDEARGEPYGCHRTHERLRILPTERVDRLAGARQMRRWFRELVPGVGPVQVYPWWFQRYGHWLDDRSLDWGAI